MFFLIFRNQGEGEDILTATERALPKVKQWQSSMKQAPARTSRQANHPLSTRFQFLIITECKSVFKKLLFSPTNMTHVSVAFSFLMLRAPALKARESISGSAPAWQISVWPESSYRTSKHPLQNCSNGSSCCNQICLQCNTAFVTDKRAGTCRKQLAKARLLVSTQQAYSSYPAEVTSQSYLSHIRAISFILSPPSLLSSNNLGCDSDVTPILRKKEYLYYYVFPYPCSKFTAK